MPKEASRPKVEHSGEPGVDCYQNGTVEPRLQWLILDNLGDALASPYPVNVNNVEAGSYLFHHVTDNLSR